MALRSPYEKIPVTRRDREEFGDLARRICGLGAAGGGASGGAQGERAAAAFPAQKPPFFGNHAVLIAPNGELWVRRAQAAEERAPMHDIIDGAGRRIATVILPANTQLLALGRRGVYLARYDEDDLIRIERYGYR